MGPMDHRNHLGLGDPPELPPPNDSVAKPLWGDPFLTPKRSPGQNVDHRPQKSIPGHPQALKNERCALKNYAEPRSRNSKRSHIVQVMAKNHFGGHLQNLHMEALAAVSRCLRRFYFFKTETLFYMEALAAVSRCLRRFYFFKTETLFSKQGALGPGHGTRAPGARNGPGGRGQGCCRRLFSREFNSNSFEECLANCHHTGHWREENRTNT